MDFTVILIKGGVHIYPQISNVRRQRRVHEECERSSVKDKWNKWRRARTKERSKSLLIQLGDYGLWLMLGNLKENVLPILIWVVARIFESPCYTAEFLTDSE